MRHAERRTRRAGVPRRQTRARRIRLSAVLLVALLLSACGATSPSRPVGLGASVPPVPRGDLYAPPNPLPLAPPGTLIWAQPVSQPKLNPPATIWRILYHSRTRTGADIAVSGFAIVPLTPVAPGAKRAVYAWAHGSQGQGDQCAPSRQIRDNLPPYGGIEIGQGVAIVATDYEGLGTPGEPTYLVGESEGHTVLDSIRAAEQLPGVGPAGPVIIAGQSQGGGAALWAAQLARSYAPGLDLRGVAALAPAAEFQDILPADHHPPFSGYLGNLLMAVDGLRSSYGTAVDPSLVLTRAAYDELGTVAKECVAQTISRWQHAPVDAVLARDPESVPSIANILNSESPGSTNPGVPIYLAQGQQDQQIPLQVTVDLNATYCRLGATVTRRVYPGVDHDGVVDAAASDIMGWIADRYAGRPATSSC